MCQFFPGQCCSGTFSWTFHNIRCSINPRITQYLHNEATRHKNCILLENSMYGTVDVAILWMKDIGKYLLLRTIQNTRSQNTESYLAVLPLA